MQYQGVVVYSMADVPLVGFAQACVLWVLVASGIQILTCQHFLLRVLALQPSPLRSVDEWIQCP